MFKRKKINNKGDTGFHEKEAIDWYTNAFYNGNSDAKRRLQEYVREGKIGGMDMPIGLDYDEGHELFTKAMYLMNENDFIGALNCLKEAARLRNPEAQDILKTYNISW